MKRIYIAEQRFGWLTALIPIHRNSNRCWVWLCKCDCGNHATIRVSDLLSGHSRSCGCYRNAQTSKANTTHGQRRNKNSLYEFGIAMRRRCNDSTKSNYKYYGGRGIRVCNRWHNFAHFESDIGPRPSPKHTLHRIDNDGLYEPGNCKWATWQEQN